VLANYHYNAQLFHEKFEISIDFVQIRGMIIAVYKGIAVRHPAVRRGGCFGQAAQDHRAGHLSHTPRTGAPAAPNPTMNLMK
jgi:hypothetical protein